MTYCRWGCRVAMRSDATTRSHTIRSSPITTGCRGAKWPATAIEISYCMWGCKVAIAATNIPITTKSRTIKCCQTRSNSIVIIRTFPIGLVVISICSIRCSIITTFIGAVAFTPEIMTTKLARTSYSNRDEYVV